MYIQKSFKILIILILAGIVSGCTYKERLNPNDPLHPDYQEPTKVIISNVNVSINYETAQIIDEDTVWDNSMGPVKVIQNILITKQATLTIMPGTEVEFFAIGPEGQSGIVGIIVDDGALNAVGNVAEPVRFIAIDGAQSYIVFRNRSIDNKCFMKYCDLHEVYLYCFAAKPTIRYNRIMYFLANSCIDFTIRDNNIETLICEHTTGTVMNNLFPFSTFYRENILIVGSYSSLDINNNNILGGKEYCIYNDSSTNIINAGNNYWNTTLSNDIKSRIYDATDNTNVGPILFNPYYTNMISGPGAGW